MYQEQFKNFGLTKTQSALLDFFFERGEAKARDIARAINQPRGAVYKALEELIDLELVEKMEKPGQVARFRPTHPGNLEKFLENRAREMEKNKKMLAGLLPQLVSGYNLGLNKPGIRFYEGEEGLEKVLYDTLNSQTEIYLLFNREAMRTEEIFEKINEEYKSRRMKSGVKKKILRIGPRPEITFGTRDDRYQAITEIRYLEKAAFPFKTVVHVYDGKVSFFTIEKGKIMAIMIEDKNIYEFNKFWFETLWENAAT
jgi:HTH-type transcriptional regulator, sugar sensing transcriptional regulator